MVIYGLYLRFSSGLTFKGCEIVFDPSYYVGCTSGKIAKRLREHRSLLKANKHTCKPLQANFNAHQCEIGIEIFEEVTKENRREREIYWMEVCKSMGRLYNEHIISFQPPNGAQAKAAATRVANGYRQSPESNMKRRMTQLGIPKGHGAKISATKRAKVMR